MTMSLLLCLYPRLVWGSWCRPFLRNEGEGIHLGICVQTDCQVSAGRSEFRAGATRHAAFGRGRVETAPSCGGSCFELGHHKPGLMSFLAVWVTDMLTNHGVPQSSEGSCAGHG